MNICEVIAEYSKDSNLSKFGKNIVRALQETRITEDVLSLAKALDVISKAEADIKDTGLDTVQGLNKVLNLEKAATIKSTPLNIINLDIERDLPEGSYYRTELENLVNKIKNSQSGKDNYGKLNGYSNNELLAMIIARDSVLDNMASSITGTQETLEDFLDKFSISEQTKADSVKYNDVLKYLMNATKGGKGDWASFATDNMGNEFARLMGISVKDNANYNEQTKVKKFIAEVGGLILSIAESDGLVDVVNIDTGEYYNKKPGEGEAKKFPWVIGTNKLKGKISYIGKEVSTAVEELGMDRVKAAPVRQAPNPNRKVHVSKQRLATAKAELEQAVHNAEATVWGVDAEGWAVLKGMLGVTSLEDYRARENEIIDRLIGMTTKDISFIRNEEGLLVDPEAKMVYDDRVAKQSTLDGAERRIKDFLEFAFEQDANGNQDFWFNWFIARNDRLHIKSSTVNPQDDKHLARWLVRPKNSSYKVTSRGLDTVLMQFKANQDPTGGHETLGKETVFVLGMLQGFEGIEIDGEKLDSIDRLLGKEVAEWFNKLVSVDEKVLKAYVEGKPAHVGHAAMAYANYLKYKAYKEGNASEFTANAVIEVDGLTNGLAFKMMQQVLSDTDKHFSVANATGIRQEEFANMQTIKATTDEKDNYVKVGDGWKEGLEKTRSVWGEFATGLVGIGYKFGDEAEGKEVRNKAKPAVMVFMYGGSAINIRREFVNEELKALLNHLTTLELTDANVESVRRLLAEVDKKLELGLMNNEGPVNEAINEASRDAIRELLSIDSNGNKLVEELKKLQTETIEGSLLKTAFTPIYHHTHGEAIQESLQSVLGDWEATNNLINGAMEYSTDVFMLLLDQEIGAIQGNADSDVRNNIEVSNYLKAAIDNAGSGKKLDMSRVYVAVSNKFTMLSKEKQRDVLDRLSDVMPMLRGKEDDVSTALVLIKEDAKAPNDNVSAIVPKLNSTANKPEFREYMAMSRVLFGPEAGTGAVGNHSQDSGTMVDTLNGFAPGKQPLNVWDAIVLDGNQYGVIKDYNKNFYWRGVDYSLMQDIAGIVSRVEARLSKDPESQISKFAEGWVGKYHIKDVSEVTARSVNAIISVANKYEANRAKMFENLLAIGQMVGPVGTTYSNKLDSYGKYRNKKKTGVIKNTEKIVTNKIAETVYDSMADTMTTEAQNDIINSATTSSITNIFDCKD